MSSENNALFSLLQKQDQEKKDLAASVYKAWHSLREAEATLLAPYNGDYNSAPKKIQATFDKGRKAYWKEWGSEGKHAKAMKERHERERESLIRREQILNDIRQSQQRNKQKQHER